MRIQFAGAKETNPAVIAGACLSPLNAMRLTKVQTLEFGKLAVKQPGRPKHLPELAIHIGQSKNGWVWAIDVRHSKGGFGYSLKNPSNAERAVESRQLAINAACTEIMDHLYMVPARKATAMLKWLEAQSGDTCKQLALFPDQPAQHPLFDEND